MLTLGVDVGSSAVKVAVLDTAFGPGRVRVRFSERYRRRAPAAVVSGTVSAALARAGVAAADLGYIASTGDGEPVPGRHGHFYGMTAHARGGLHLVPRARSVLDLGALHARAIRVDARGRVLGYRMSSQCASGTGQFLENIARYLGVALADIGPLSLTADRVEPVSSICAVLAETDVVNLVARGVPAAAVLLGIHRSVAGRLSRLLRTARAEGPVVLTGGMAADIGLLASLRDQLASEGLALELVAPDDAAYAGAIGAAIWGAHRAARPRRAGEEHLHVEP